MGQLRADPREKPFSDDPRRMKELELVAAGSDLAILGREEADLGVMRVADAQPIEAALGEANGALVIELKVPLVFSVQTPIAVDTQPGRTISIGLDTSEPKIKKSRGSRSEDAEGAGGSGGRGGHGYGGGGRGGMGGGMGSRSHGERDVARSYGKPLKAWVVVPLAAAPATPRS